MLIVVILSLGRFAVANHLYHGRCTYVRQAGDLASAGRTRLARRLYRQALLENPIWIDAWMGLGNLEFGQGSYSEAERCYRAVLAIDERRPIPHNNLALVLKQFGCYEGAAFHYQRALELDPGYADAHYNCGCLYDAQGKMALAIEHYVSYLVYGDNHKVYESYVLRRLEQLVLKPMERSLSGALQV